MAMIARITAWAIRAIILVSILITGGFAFFLVATTPQSVPEKRTADGIVALTGGKARIGEAVKLLAGKKAERMLISGVHPDTTSGQLRRLVPHSATLFECCIDLGRQAQDTTGNALETRDWVRKHKYTSIIVVTSSYHMPRALVELRRLLPGVDMVPHTVVPESFNSARWWADDTVMRLIVSEYIKYLPALARFCMTRLMGGADAKA